MVQAAPTQQRQLLYAGKFTLFLYEKMCVCVGVGVRVRVIEGFEVRAPLASG